jgi:hypothetical protein
MIKEPRFIKSSLEPLKKWNGARYRICLAKAQKTDSDFSKQLTRTYIFFCLTSKAKTTPSDFVLTSRLLE